MKAYPKYKDSGITWIGQIPEHWEVRKFKFCFNERNEKNHPKETKLSATQTHGVIPQALYETKGNHVVDVNKDFDKLKFVKVGDFVIHLRSFQGGIEYAYHQGIISAAYTILTPIENKSSQYYKYLLKSYPFIQLLKTCVTGIREGQNIDYSILGNRFIPLVPLAEQEEIVRWIESKTLKIDTYVAERERELAMLSELRQAEIARAVTHGLNPDVPMKDTGIPWIPQIPIHWELVTLRGISEGFFKGNGITKLDIDENGDFPCIRYADIYTKYNFTFTSCEVKTNKSSLQTLVYANEGDILFAGTGESIDDIGKSIAYIGKEPILVGGDIIVMKHSQSPRFLGYCLDSNISKQQKSFGKSKLKVVHIKPGELKNIVIALPPREEQDLIADFIKTKQANLNQMIEDLTHQLELLKEYKQRLISDAVTGKIDVRSKEISTDAQ